MNRFLQFCKHEWPVLFLFNFVVLIGFAASGVSVYLWALSPILATVSNWAAANSEKYKQLSAWE